ncbi:MAG: phosphoadenosine phosphosulfate reductase, partial [Hungatella sp.]
MWCKTCNIETNEKICPVCSTVTDEDIPVEIHWCSHCNIPVIKESNQVDKNVCPLCGEKLRYLATDLRPVFPEERLL